MLVFGLHVLATSVNSAADGKRGSLCTGTWDFLLSALCLASVTHTGL